MKCGSCRDVRAETYKKINEDDSLLEVLKNLNSRRPYNPKYLYFCGVCINAAKNKLSHKLSLLSDQIVSSFTTLNESTATSNSGSSKDEYDMIVASKIVFSDTGTPISIPQNRNKRIAGKDERPCPKRFKKPLIPIQDVSSQMMSNLPTTSKQLSNIPEVSTSQAASSEQRSSESIPENEILLNVQDEASSVSSESSSASVEDDQNKTTRLDHATNSNRNMNKDTPTQKAIGAGSTITKGSHQNTGHKTILDSSNLSHHHAEQAPDRRNFIPGPTAPPVKNPRMRQDNTNLATDLRQYFSTQTINIANYSRTIAG